MRRSVFTIGDFADAYIGYTSGYLWNGWATPYFEKDEAERVVAGYNELALFPMYYDADSDSYKTDDVDGFDGDCWQGEDIQTEDGTKHLYGIGAYSWVWDDDGTKRAKKYYAQGIEEFMLFYDEEYEIDMERIAEKFKDLNTYCEAIRILKSEELNANQCYEKLKGILEL